MPLTAKPINEEIRKEILALLDQQLSTSMSSPACGFARASALPLAPEEIERDQLLRFGADFVAGVGDEIGRDAAAARSRCRSGRRGSWDARHQLLQKNCQELRNAGAAVCTGRMLGSLCDAQMAFKPGANC